MNNPLQIVRAANRAGPINTVGNRGRQMVRFQRTKKFLSSGTKHMLAYAAIAGLETLLPLSYLTPGFTIALCVGIPSTIDAISTRGVVNTKKVAVKIFWYITFLTAAGIVQTLIVTPESNMFTPWTNAMKDLVDKRIKKSAPKNSASYKFAFYFAQFIRACYMAAGYPVPSAHDYGRRFAANWSGSMGSYMVHILKETIKVLSKAGKYTIKASTKYPKTMRGITVGGVSLAGLRSLKKRRNTQAVVRRGTA
jgi:hypothetical protein